MKVMVTGAHGFVGARAAQHYKDAVCAPGELVRNAGEALMDYIKGQHPDLILNCAAISDIGTCEKNPDASYAANVMLPVVLAKAAKAVHAKLISFSSDQVYTGCVEAGAYKETDLLPPPANVYACHKLEAEQRVLELTPDAVMLRATWMYDMPVYGEENRGNFFVNTLVSAMRDRTITASSCQYRGITYVRQVVSLFDKAFDLPGGVYNYGSENPLNMLETTRALLDVLGVDRYVQDTKQSRHNLWMDCGRLREHNICFDTTAEGLKRCAEDYGLGCLQMKQ